ncbi:class I SAM-dependent methyltransferase [Arenibacter sp. TNZ]|jgi:SAM-dependent methyltransferase|uniref:class I SAM-dependent methyltransferase n=1 Tax=Arenibacter TaxID=178469 RepID=UPI000CD428A3|nr:MULTISPECIES: class I SAM-dependent methyltransferase [Arenibacter]MCM4169994.1 class I SAM-dependent methyltransferase [Arenibacter sp. TNZ]
MKKALDRFSVQSRTYKEFRPTYPEALYKYIYANCISKVTCWDCGTGNGQVAAVLSDTFDQVFATDISEQQIKHAVPKPNIKYSVQRAEITCFPNQYFDLITVAQALHWFDLPAFNKEVNRLLKPNGLIAIWGYGLLTIDLEIDVIVNHFYQHIIGGYWDKERAYIDLNYSNIPFHFDEIDIQESFNIETQWTIDQLRGYFNSWSSVQNYKDNNNGHNPVDELINKIAPIWTSKVKKIVFPIFIRAGHPNK